MSTLIRNTTTLECGIDRHVGNAGHGEHGGWSLSQGTTIICSCGERLFRLADLKAAEAAEGLSSSGMGPNVVVGGYQAAAGNLTAQLLVRNIAFDKQVAIVYTTDNWLTCRTASGIYSPPITPAGTPDQPAPNCGTSARSPSAQQVSSRLFILSPEPPTGTTTPASITHSGRAAESAR